MAPTLPVLPPALAARFRLGEILGRGGMGVVLRAEDLQLGREVALKLPLASGDPALLERFGREARSMARVRHPHLVEIFDSGMEEGQPFLVMECLPGPSLGQLLGEAGPFAPHRVVDLLLPVAEALDALHAAGVVHRDVKPGNILLGGGSRPVLMDLGLARPCDEVALTESGWILGTPEYLSPEALRGEEAGPASDWWAWGCTLHWMLLGSLPFALSELLEGSRRGRLPDRQPVQQRLPEALEGLLEAILCFHPEERLGGAAAILGRLRQGSPGGTVGVGTRESSGDREETRLQPPLGADPAVSGSLGDATRPLPGPPGDATDPLPGSGSRPRLHPGVLLGIAMASLLGLLGQPGGVPPPPAAPPSSSSPRAPADPPVSSEGRSSPLPSGEDLDRAVDRAWERASLSYRTREGDLVVLGDGDPEEGWSPLLDLDPGRWMAIRSGIPLVARFDAWVRQGGRPDLLSPEDRLRLERLDRMALREGLPRFFSPWIDTHPLPPGPAPLLEEELRNPGNQFLWPEEVPGWLGAAALHAARCRERQRFYEAELESLDLLHLPPDFDQPDVRQGLLLGNGLELFLEKLRNGLTAQSARFLTRYRDFQEPGLRFLRASLLSLRQEPETAEFCAAFLLEYLGRYGDVLFSLHLADLEPTLLAGYQPRGAIECHVFAEYMHRMNLFALFRGKSVRARRLHMAKLFRRAAGAGRREERSEAYRSRLFYDCLRELYHIVPSVPEAREDLAGVVREVDLWMRGHGSLRPGIFPSRGKIVLRVLAEVLDLLGEGTGTAFPVARREALRRWLAEQAPEAGPGARAALAPHLEAWERRVPPR